MQKWIKVNAYTSQKDYKEVITGIATDITKEKDYSNTLHKFSDKKNSILQILSHDLLGPLGSIEMSALLLSEDMEHHTNAKAIKLIDTIRKSGKKSVAMIRDLINNEFLQSSEASLVKQRVDIVKKMSDIIDQYQQSPGSVSQRFSLTTSLDSLYITIDESKFIQAITNLLSNALKFTSDDGNIKVSIEEKEKHVLITIADNGIGIPADMQPFLFDKFTKARRQGIHGETTIGLGMSIIKTIVEWHNGHIWFESTEGKGTTFYIEIPRDN